MTARNENSAMCGARRARWRGTIVAIAVVAASVGVAACGGDDAGNVESSGATKETDAPSTPTDASASGSDAAPEASIPLVSQTSQLDVDPCTLLTVAEIEAFVGSGVVHGGFGEDLPGRCTYSVGGDVGAGVVAISIEDPIICAAIQNALDNGVSGQQTKVDVGQGGVADGSGLVQFLVGGGCIGIGGSTGGESLPVDSLVTLAMAAAPRVG